MSVGLPGGGGGGTPGLSSGPGEPPGRSPGPWDGPGGPGARHGVEAEMSARVPSRWWRAGTVGDSVSTLPCPLSLLKRALLSN